MSLIFRRPRSNPPSVGTPLSGDPLVKGLVAVFVLDETTAGLRERISGVKASGSFGPSGSTIRYGEPDGAYLRALYLSGSYVTWQPGAAFSPFQLSSAFSVAWGGSFDARSTNPAYFWSLFTSARTNDISARSVSGALTIQINGTDYNVGVSTDTHFDGTRRRADACVSWSADSALIDTSARGVLLSQTATSNSPANLGANPYLTVGNYSGLNINEAFPGGYAYLYVYNRKLTPGEAAALAANPWRIFAPLPRRRVGFSAGGAGSHAASGALAAGSATISGTAAHSALHTTSGALTGQAATIAGTATHLTLHAASGALAAGSATIAGAATHPHIATGALSASAAAISGSATLTPLAGTHATSGALTADAASIAGSATHLTLHAASGALSASAATISGASVHTAPVVARITLRLFDKSESGRVIVPSVTGIDWAFYDAATTLAQAVATTPTDSGSGESSDGSGVLVLDLPNTSLTSGQYGWLMFSNADGTTTQDPPPRTFGALVAID